MPFLTIRTRDNQDEFRLAIVRGSFEVIPDVQVNITDLNQGSDGRYKHFFNNGYAGLTFKCQVMLKRSRAYRVGPVEKLHEWYINSTPLIVATDVIDIRHGQSPTNLWDTDGLYIITKNSSRKQVIENYTIWDMEFTSYTPLNVWRYKNDNAAILSVLNKAKTAQKNKGKTKSALLSACDKSKFKKSKKKKSTECNKILQQILKENGCYLQGNIDGWYGPETALAIAKFQKKIGSIGNGKIDNKTFKALIK